MRAESAGDVQGLKAADLCERQGANAELNAGEAHNALGALWQAERKPTRAKESYARALQVNSKLYPARYNLGMMALKERRYADAAREFNTVLSGSPDFPMAAERLACAQTGLQQEQSRDRAEKRRLREALKQCSR